MRCLRPLCLALLALLWLDAAHAQESKTFTETVAIDASGEVVIDNYKGSISVTTWNRDEVSIEVVIKADGDPELVEDTRILVSSSSGTVRIETDYEEAKRRHKGFLGLFGGGSYSLPFAHYTIRMPRTADLTIDDYKSDIDVTDLTADLEVDTYKGKVDVKGLDGALRLDTYKGDVRVAFSRLADDSYADTYKGEIDLWIPRNAGFDLDADVGRKGDLDSDFSLTLRSRDDDRFRGTVNGGGPRLHLETYKGSFRLRSN